MNKTGNGQKRLRSYTFEEKDFGQAKIDGGGGDMKGMEGVF